MNKEILEALKTKFEGVSESVLGRVANTMAKTATTNEEIATFVEGATIQKVIESYADQRATEAAHTAVRNYELKHKLKEGVKLDTPDGTTQSLQPQNSQQGGAENIPAWAQTLIETNKRLEGRLAEMETERTTSKRKTQLAAVISKLPENIRKPYERITLDTMKDEEFATLLSDIGTEVDGITSSINSKGVVFGRPASMVGPSNGTELTEEQQRLIAHRDSKPADKDGQPF